MREYVDFILRETDMRLGACDWGIASIDVRVRLPGGDSGPILCRDGSVYFGLGCANFAVTEKHRPVWEARRQRNGDLLVHPAIDPESRTLAAARVEESDRILAELDHNRVRDGG